MSQDNRFEIQQLAIEIQECARDGYLPGVIEGLADQIRFLAWDDIGVPPFGADNEETPVGVDSELVSG